MNEELVAILKGVCLDCERETEIHQPDPTRPGRVLITCGAHHCGRWWILDTDLGQAERVPLTEPPCYPDAVSLG